MKLEVSLSRNIIFTSCSKNERLSRVDLKTHIIKYQQRLLTVYCNLLYRLTSQTDYEGQLPLGVGQSIWILV